MRNKHVINYIKKCALSLICLVLVSTFCLVLSTNAADYTYSLGNYVEQGSLVNQDENPGGYLYNGDLYYLISRGEGYYGNSFPDSIKIFKGTKMDDLTYQYSGTWDSTFTRPHGDDKYWLSGLWIDSNGDFYSLVHHEFNYGQNGIHFRQIDIAKSTDQGRNWTKLGAAITSPNSTNINDYKGNWIDGGCGDPSLFVDNQTGYFYVYYVQKVIKKTGGKEIYHRVYVARSAISNKMAPGSWHKFYNGSWDEDGVGGKATWLSKISQYPQIRYSYYLSKYIDVAQYTMGATSYIGIQTCTDMNTQNWTIPETLGSYNPPLSYGYMNLIDAEPTSDTHRLSQSFRFYMSPCNGSCYYWPVSLGTGTSSKVTTKWYNSIGTNCVDGEKENLYFEQSPVLNWNYPGKIIYCSNSLNYVGTWTEDYSVDDYSGGSKYSSNAGDFVELSFPGNSVSVVARKTPDSGKCDIYLDDFVTPIATDIDLYSASTLNQQTIYTNNSISQGNHVIRIKVKGTRNASSSGYKVYLDYIQFEKGTSSYDCLDTPTGVVATPDYDSISINWNSVTSASAYNIYRTSNSDGTQLRMIKKGVTGTSYVDTDVSAGTTYYYKVTAIDSDGKESIRSAAAECTMGAWITVNDDGPGINHSTGWTVWRGSGHINNDVHYSSTTGAYFEFTFTGTDIIYVADKAPNHGKCDVYIDGVLDTQDIDLYSPSIVYQYEAFTKTGMSPGQHTIKVVVNGTKNSSSSGYQIDVDAFKFK